MTIVKLRGSIKNFKEALTMILEDEFTSDEDFGWWQGVIYGLFLAGAISNDEKVLMDDILRIVKDSNVEVLNNGGERVECL